MGLPVEPGVVESIGRRSSRRDGFARNDRARAGKNTMVVPRRTGWDAESGSRAAAACQVRRQGQVVAWAAKRLAELQEERW